MHNLNWFRCLENQANRLGERPMSQVEQRTEVKLQLQQRSPAQVTFPMVMIVIRVAKVVMLLPTPPLGCSFPKSVL